MEMKHTANETESSTDGSTERTHRIGGRRTLGAAVHEGSSDCLLEVGVVLLGRGHEDIVVVVRERQLSNEQEENEM
jgi:hypothetical protein